MVGSIWLKVGSSRQGIPPLKKSVKSLYTSDRCTQCLQTPWGAADWNLADPGRKLDDCSIEEASVPDGEL